LPDVLDEVAKLAEARGYRVEKSGTTLTIHHPYLEPLSIRVSLEDERLALELGLGEIRDYIGADSLAYISIGGLMRAVGNDQSYCKACFDGHYII